MNSMKVGSESFILDADVLIDFITADRTVLTPIVDHVGMLHVVSPVLRQVKIIGSREELTGLGVVAIEPAIEDLYAAANTRSSADFEDQICFLTAKRHGFTCVTNDRKIRRQCKESGVRFLWGLQLILKLHKSSGIKTRRAIELAERIRENNPRHITAKIVDSFKVLINQQAGES